MSISCGVSFKALIVAMLGGMLCAGCSKDSATPAGSSASPVAPPSAVEIEQTRRKADGGDAAAQNLLGEIYLNGQGVRADSKTAYAWFSKAAVQGYAPAQFNLGTLYESGQGVTVDNAQAVSWYRKAAEQGHAVAQYSLAATYAYGRGVERNNQEALKWLTLAAEQGDAMAEYGLGERFRTGTGVTRDLVEAFKWFSLAAAQNVGDAATALNEIKPEMKSDQTAEGKKRAREFVPKHPPISTAK